MRLTIIAVGIALMAGIAYADEPQLFEGKIPVVCGDVDTLLKATASVVERPVIEGKGNPYGILVLQSPPDKDTFTIIMVLPDGNACGIAAGTNWHEIPQETLRKEPKR